jgi:hypothetical protein
VPTSLKELAARDRRRITFEMATGVENALRDLSSNTILCHMFYDKRVGYSRRMYSRVKYETLLAHIPEETDCYRYEYTVVIGDLAADEKTPLGQFIANRDIVVNFVPKGAQSQPTNRRKTVSDNS